MAAHLQQEDEEDQQQHHLEVIEETREEEGRASTAATGNFSASGESVMIIEPDPSVSDPQSPRSNSTAVLLVDSPARYGSDMFPSPAPGSLYSPHGDLFTPSETQSPGGILTVEDTQDDKAGEVIDETPNDNDENADEADSDVNKTLT